MKEVGRRIFYDELTGKIIFEFGEMRGDVEDYAKYNKINYKDYPYGYRKEEFERALKYHIDIETGEVIFDKFIEKIETEEERLRREKEELENQLLDAQEHIVNEEYKKLLNQGGM
ncbi:hypothetical protein [Clostridium faecium]|uniref:Uncharacterized protein n=1 Tax=Clostridium faecium TaxID=2762223 RepID=A0ABR8YR55_9CLOT|nr:hypothetical protein [Clostridium faecium]MBD8046742.1 hypothetical protein [Clostridium faecium]